MMVLQFMRTSPLTRSNNGMIGGVCQGLAERFDVSPLLLRLGLVCAVLFAGTGIAIYLALWWVLPLEGAVPEEPIVWQAQSGQVPKARFARAAVDRKVFGVCGGLAAHWGLDSSIVRLAVLSLATFSLGFVAIAYLIVAALAPSPVTTVQRVVESQG